MQTQPLSMGSRTNTGQFGSPAPFSSGGENPYSPAVAASPSQPFIQPHNRSFSQGNMQQQISPPSVPAPPYSSASPVGAAPQLGALSFQSAQSPVTAPPPQHTHQPSHERQGSIPMGAGFGAGKGGASPPQYSQPPAPPKPMFGVHLSRLYERDGLAVPSVVHQCIQAVDLFGLGVEGIYRQSGSLAHINKLKHMFDTGKQARYATTDCQRQTEYRAY